MVRGYHTYQNMWADVFGEELPCQKGQANLKDPFPVVVKKGMLIIGHVQRKISALCSMFLGELLDSGALQQSLLNSNAL